MSASHLPALSSIQMNDNTNWQSLIIPLLQTASGIRTYLALRMWESYVLFWLASSQNCRNDLRFPFVQYYTTLLSDCQLIITWLVHILFCGNQQAFTQYTVILGALRYFLVQFTYRETTNICLIPAYCSSAFIFLYCSRVIRLPAYRMKILSICPVFLVIHIYMLY